MRFIASWKLAWRIARREARASAPKFLFAVLGVATGVGALTGVRGFADAFQEELQPFRMKCCPVTCVYSH